MGLWQGRVEYHESYSCYLLEDGRKVTRMSAGNGAVVAALAFLSLRKNRIKPTTYYITSDDGARLYRTRRVGSTDAYAKY